MSRLISDILNAPEPTFSHALKDYELRSGKPGHDARLLSDIAQVRRKVLEHLGLDEFDTTQPELYYALRQTIHVVNQRLEQKLSITNDNSPEEVLEAVVAYIDSLGMKRNVWVLRHVFIKNILKQNPPKRTMKIFGLRSIDSVLKRTNAYELYTIAQHVESQEWREKITAKLKKVTPREFDQSSSAIFTLNTARSQKLVQSPYHPQHNIMTNFETGSIVAIVPPKRFTLDTLAILTTLIECLADARLHSAYFKFRSIRPHFAKHFVQAVEKNLPGEAEAHAIGWKSVRDFFAAKPETFSTIEGPHFDHSDVKDDSVLRMMVIDIPELRVFDGVQYAVIHDKVRPLSLNINDVIYNAINLLPYEEGTYSSGSAHLRSELGKRYLDNQILREEIIRSIEE